MRKCLKARSAISIFCLLALCSVLTACSGIAGVSTTATPTVVATHAPTPTPTPIPTPTPTPTPAITFTTITGNGYTIKSPSGWTSSRDTTTAAGITVLTLTDVLLSDADSTSMAIGTAPDSRAGDPGFLSEQVQAVLSGSGHGPTTKNFQKKNVPATVTINGVQWEQAAATWENTTIGKEITTYEIATPFPSDTTKVVVITYNSLLSEFDQVNTEDFQPMLLSFKFT